VFILHLLNFTEILVNKLEKDTKVAQLFNNDILHVQQYLFTKLKIEPTCKVQVQYKDSKLLVMRKIDNEETPQPPFSSLYFEIATLSDFSDSTPLRKITVTHNEQHVSFDGPEETILQDFCKYVLENDPDILICVTTHNRSVLTITRYLFTRAKMLRVNFQLGRQTDDTETLTDRTQGRVLLNGSPFLNEFGLAGLVERSRFSFLPLGMAAQYGINRLIDSRNCYEMIQQGYVIPKNDFSLRHEHIRTLEEIVSRDKGGMIFSPNVGLHENVVVLDYDSEYANLILMHNLSYETVVYPRSVIQATDKGLLPTVIEKVLKRRLSFKDIKQKFDINISEWLWCEQRLGALKNILVSLYGTTGSFWNRHSNVLALEEINKISREVLIKTKDIVQEQGFELVYADTDSVFLKKQDASRLDYENVKDILIRETRLPISLQQHFKFLMLLPLAADEEMEALKHYFGITQDNELIARGIEIRRHDAPNFIKEFQTELLYTLFDCKDSAEVISKGYENALLLITKTIDRVVTGEVQLQDLVVSKFLRQDLDKYRSLFPHVAAAIQLGKSGKSSVRGDSIQYIHTNAHHSNPLCRVTALDLVKQEQELNYDKEKYREILLEAAETILGYFGFDMTIYATKTTKNKNRKWWHELREERIRDIETERM